MVIGIITILIAILLPALGRARDQARGVACSSGLRQLILACHMFAQDHGGRLPGNHDDALDAAFPNPDPEKRSWLTGDNVSAATTLQDAPHKGTLFRYVKDANLYRCQSRDQIGGATSGSAYTNEKFDYTVVKCFTGARLASIPSESTYTFVGPTSGGMRVRYPTPYFVEETSYRVVLHNVDGGWSNVDEHSDHHRGGSYYAALDGSVHFFMGRKRGPASDRAEAWQWEAKSPVRGNTSLGNFVGTSWGWWDRSN